MSGPDRSRACTYYLVAMFGFLKRWTDRKLTIFGRSLLIVVLELFANALSWIIAGFLFGRNSNTRPVLNLAVLAWVRIQTKIMVCSTLNDTVSLRLLG
jgi:hypothetical protein